MPEVRDAASMAREGRILFKTDEKSEVLRKLQGRIYFEKRLSASSASNHGYCALTLPLWFVEEHGDKFRKTVILRSESSAKSWNVKLTIQYESSACNRQVKFSAGWKGFAASYGLLVGDSLVFLLTAMSEFTVHIFPGVQNPERIRSELEPREWSDGSEPSRKRAKQESYGIKDEQSADEEGSEGTVQSNGVFAKKKTVGDERAVSSSSHSTTSCSPSSSSENSHHFKFENVQESALDSVEPRGSGFIGNVITSERRDASMARKGRMSFSADDKTEVLRKLQGRICFEKSLSASNASQLRGSKLTMPSWFVREHGDKFQRSVILRTESSTKQWDVKLTIKCGSPSSARVKFSGGWRAFADFNSLLEGDTLVFCLTAMSEFKVYVFSGTGNPKACPASEEQMIIF